MLQVYCVGGTGVNVGLLLDEEIQRAYFDTSDRNVDSNNPDAYIVKGTSGSGSVRSTNAEVIMDSIPEFMLKHPEAEYNVVIFNTGGGTGSVGGPGIIKYLLEKGANVIGLAVSVQDTERTSHNTLATFQTLSNFQREAERPLPLIIQSNDVEGVTIDNVNMSLVGDIRILNILLSTPHGRLDREDIRNWFNYHLSTSAPAEMVTVQIAFDDETLKTFDQSPIAVLSLFTDPSEKYDPRILNDQVAYQKAGHADEFLHPSGKTIDTDRIYYVIEMDNMEKIEKDVKSSYDHHVAIAKSRKSRKGAFSSNTDGMVF